MRQKYISAFPDDHILQSSSFWRPEIEIVLLWVYWLDITKNVIVFIHACSLILRGAVWNFFFSARLHLFCKRQPSGSLHMLFLDNTCHKSGWSVPYDFSWSSALTRCFISPCNLISISQHLLNIYRRTSIRQFSVLVWSTQIIRRDRTYFILP